MGLWLRNNSSVPWWYERVDVRVGVCVHILAVGSSQAVAATRKSVRHMLGGWGPRRPSDSWAIYLRRIRFWNCVPDVDVGVAYMDSSLAIWCENRYVGGLAGAVDGVFSFIP